MTITMYNSVYVNITHTQKKYNTNITHKHNIYIHKDNTHANTNLTHTHKHNIHSNIYITHTHTHTRKHKHNTQILLHWLYTGIISSLSHIHTHTHTHTTHVQQPQPPSTHAHNNYLATTSRSVMGRGFNEEHMYINNKQIKSWILISHAI